MLMFLELFRRDSTTQMLKKITSKKQDILTNIFTEKILIIEKLQ